ncbi:MAG TPA: Uma2 family endonuclease [Blastocatellia bacterium]|nr:Uma2 family endonuclease [Blastocatellia bacterium]
MPVASADFVAAVAHLPHGACLRINDVPWEEYEQLLADLGEGYSARIYYDEGRLEIMSPDSVHEKHKGIIHRLIGAVSDELDLDIESFGSTTFKAERKGAEPDECFYVQNASSVIGRHGDLDLNCDPPPDIVVEVDRTSTSLDKFPIYAALGVPEIWRITGGGVEIHRLSEHHYIQSNESRAFPVLTAEALSRFLALGLAEGERKAAQALRAWLRGIRKRES